MVSTRRSLTFVGLLLCLALALGLRALGAPFVFVDGDVVLDPWDGAYHARRALYTFVRFPDVLVFDPYLRFPDGAPVPFPPLYDWFVGALARVFATTPEGFARVAAWVSPGLSALCVLPVFAMARRLFDAPTAWLACGLFVLLPASTMNAGVGDLDHHAAVALWVAAHVAFTMRLVSPRAEATWVAAIAGAAMRAAIVLTWTGSLLYVALGEAALLCGALRDPRAEVLRTQAVSTLTAAMLVAPVVVICGTPLGGRFSSTELSWLHVIALGAAGTVWVGLWLWQQRSSTRDPNTTALRVLVVGGLVMAGLLLVPTLRHAVLPGLAFVAKADTWAPINAEQAPLFPWMSAGRAMGSDLSHRLFGFFAYGIVLVPFIPFVSRDPARLRPDRIVFAIWSLVLGLLTLAQLRFGSDFAALGSVGFAALTMFVARRVALRLGQGGVIALACAIAVACMAPAFDVHRPRVPAFLRFVAGEVPAYDPSLVHGDAALVRFAERVRSLTPETSGYFDSQQRPEYSILALPSHGHVIHWAARRPAPANNFGPYLDAEKVDAVHRFYRTTRATEAIEIMDGLQARYVMTSAAFWLAPGTVSHFLHMLDGSESGRASGLGRLRLVGESAPGSRTTFAAFPRGAPRGVIPYKLWERVAGAVVRVDVEPGERVRAELDLVTHAGRAFRYAASARADTDGVAQLRLAYATGARTGVRAPQPYHVTSGTRIARVSVTEDAVREGKSQHVELEKAN